MEKSGIVQFTLQQLVEKLEKTCSSYLDGNRNFFRKVIHIQISKDSARKPFCKTKMGTIWYAKVQQLFKPASHYKLILKFLLLFVVSCLTFQAMAIQYWAFPWWQISYYFCQVSCISMYYKWGNITDLKQKFIIISSVLQHTHFILGYILYKILLIDHEQKMQTGIILLWYFWNVSAHTSMKLKLWNLVRKMRERLTLG